MQKTNYCTNFENCRNSITYGHNGLPMYDGRVCDDCNQNVIRKRIYLMRRYII
jgi:hypothetical protein